MGSVEFGLFFVPEELSIQLKFAVTSVLFISMNAELILLLASGIKKEAVSYSLFKIISICYPKTCKQIQRPTFLTIEPCGIDLHSNES